MNIHKKPIGSSNPKMRALVACTRCKKRKKKCDGKVPTCYGCRDSGNVCHYNRELSHGIENSREQEAKLTKLMEQVKEYEAKLQQLTSSSMRVEEYRAGLEGDHNKLAIIKLATQPSNEEVYIGKAAVISKVQAIRKILTNEINEKSLTDNVLNHSNSVGSVPSIRASAELERTFMKCYLRFLRNRYHFVEKAEIIQIFSTDPSLRSSWDNFIIYTVLASGGRIAELQKISNWHSCEYYFNKCLESLTEIPTLTQRQQIKACMQIALYLHYSCNSKNSYIMNVWELSGMAIRKLTQLGLHRKKSLSKETAVEYEMDKRLFWSVYAFDRLLSLSLGRTLSICDIEIDSPFPLSLDLVDILAENLYELQRLQNENPFFSQPVTSITYLVETCRIRQIEGCLNILTYGGNNEFTLNETHESLSIKLEEWLARLPSRNDFNESLNFEVTYDYLLLDYHRMKLFLILPRITSKLGKEVEKEVLLKACATSGNICQCFKRIQKDALFGYSTYSLHTLFLAGVTSVYCMCYLGNPSDLRAHNDIRACSNLLFSFAERDPEAEIYRSLFEKLSESVLYNRDIDENNHTDVFKDAEIIHPEVHFASRNNLSFNDRLFNFTFDDDFWRRLEFE